MPHMETCQVSLQINEVNKDDHSYARPYEGPDDSETVIKIIDDAENLDSDSVQLCLNVECMEFFESMNERDIHMETCQVYFKIVEVDKVDQSDLHSDGKFVLNCQFCSETFSTEDKKKEHEERYINSDGQLLLVYKGCNGVYKSNKCLSQHIKFNHYY